MERAIPQWIRRLINLGDENIAKSVVGYVVVL